MRLLAIPSLDGLSLTLLLKDLLPEAFLSPPAPPRPSALFEFPAAPPWFLPDGFPLVLLLVFSRAGKIYSQKCFTCAS